MSTEQILLALLALVTGGGGWWTKTIWADHKETRASLDAFKLKVTETYMPKTDIDKKHQELLDRLDRVGNLELLLARQYVTKVELKEIFSSFDGKLDKISERIERR